MAAISTFQERKGFRESVSRTRNSNKIDKKNFVLAADVLKAITTGRKRTLVTGNLVARPLARGKTSTDVKDISPKKKRKREMVLVSSNRKVSKNKWRENWLNWSRRGALMGG